MQISFDVLKESAKVSAALCSVGLDTGSDELAASKISCSWNADEESFLLLQTLLVTRLWYRNGRFNKVSF